MADLQTSLKYTQMQSTNNNVMFKECIWDMYLNYMFKRRSTTYIHIAKMNSNHPQYIGKYSPI